MGLPTEGTIPELRERLYSVPLEKRGIAPPMTSAPSNKNGGKEISSFSRDAEKEQERIRELTELTN